MNIRSVYRRPAEWLVGTWVDRNIGTADGGQDTYSVASCAGEGSISVDSTDTKEVEGGMMCCEEDSEHILW